jgi:WD40 repeat protein
MLVMAARRARKASSKKAALDRSGDPLPAGAMTRLGTLRFRLDDAYATHFAVSFDGARAAARIDRLQVRVWDLETGVALRTLRCKPGSDAKDWIERIVLSRDGARVATYVYGRIQVFEVASGDPVGEVVGPIEQAFELTPDGRGVIVAGHGYQRVFARRHELATGAIAAETELGQEVRVASVTLTEDGRKVIFVVGRRVAIHDADTLAGETDVRVELAGSSLVKGTVVVGDDELLMLRYTGDESTLVELRSGAARPFVWPQPGELYDLVASAGHRMAYAIRGPEHLREVIDLRTRQVLLRLPASSGGCEAAFSRDHLVLRDHSLLRRFELPSLREVEHPADGGHTGEVRAVRFDGPVVVTYGREATRRWDAATAKELACGERSDPPPPPVPAHGVTARRCRPDERGVQAFRGDVMLFELRTEAVKGVAVCPTDPEVAFVSWHGWLRVVDAETGALKWSFQSPSNKVLQPLTRVAYSPDGALIAAGGHGKFAALFERSGRRIDLVGHTAKIDALAFSPSGKVLFTRDVRTTRIWDGTTGEALGVLEGLWPDAWSPDGALAATIEHTSVVLWRVEDVLPANVRALLA